MGGGKLVVFSIIFSIFATYSLACQAADPYVPAATISGDLVAPSFGFATNRVEAGETVTQSARAIVSPEGRLYKQGGGTWVLPAATIQQSWAANITVSEGTLEYQSGGTAPAAPADLSDSVKAKALLWVDAADPDETHFRNGESAATLGALFTTWHDRRETDVENPEYAYAKAYTVYAAAYPRWKSISAGRAVNFGDKINSGVAMEWKMPDGTRFGGGNFNTSMVKTVFAVYNNYYQQSGATIFGSLSGNPSPFQGEGAKYWSSDSTWPTMVNGRTYVNGERIDGTTETQPAQSTKLIEGWQCWNKDVKTASFFGTGSKSTSGGSFLHEAIVFTNELTETERLEVETYLMSRWSPLSAGGAGAREITVDAGATLAADTDAISGESLSVSGRGTFAKSGAGVWTNALDSAFEGSFDIKAGSVALLSPAATAAVAGKNFRVANTLDGPVMTVENGKDGTIAKKGDDLAAVVAVPEDVSTVSVDEGTLRLGSLCASQGSRTAYEIPLANPGFEDYAEDIASLSAGDGVKKMPISDTPYHSWSCAGGYAYAMDYPRWTGSSTDMGAARSTWNVYAPPPDGNCAMLIRGTGSSGSDSEVRSAPFSLGESGAYELSFKMGARQADAYLGQKLKVRLLVRRDGALSVAGTFGTARVSNIAGYRAFRMRIDGLKADSSGEYLVDFIVPHGVVSGGLCIIDDVHLFKVPDDPSLADIWKIPGGDFEDGAIPGGAAAKEFSVGFTHPNWTFVQSASWTEGAQADAGLSTLAATNTASAYGTGVYYNNSREPGNGSVECAIVKNGAAAETTFTPSAGVWVVECDIAKLGSYGQTPSLSATVEIGGVPTPLGTLTPATKMMTGYAWPGSFTADGATPVMLSLTLVGGGDGTGGSTSGIVIDDVRLRRAPVAFAGGDCEDWKKDGYPYAFDSTDLGGGSGVARHRKPSEAAYAFGAALDGAYVITLEGLSGLYEDIAFPRPGLYRLSFHAHSRLGESNKSEFPPNPVRGWIARDGATNELGRADAYNDAWVKRNFDFEVAEPGTYRVALQGTSTAAKSEVHIDGISLERLGDAAEAKPPVPKTAKVIVKSGARIEACFAGTNIVRQLRLGNTSVGDIASAKTHPAYISGPGVFRVVQQGMSISFR